MSSRLQAGSIHAKEINMVLSKLLNFILVVTNSLFAEPGYSPYGRKSTPTKIEGSSPDEIEGSILGSILKCISLLDNFNPYLDTLMRRHTESIIILFFELFFRKVSKQITFT